MKTIRVLDYMSQLGFFLIGFLLGSAFLPDIIFAVAYWIFLFVSIVYIFLFIKFKLECRKL